MKPPRKVPGIENRQGRRRDGSIRWSFWVRWLDPATGQRLSEHFDEQRDAIDFKATMRLARRSGVLADLGAGRETLAEYAEEWWERYASRNLSRATLKVYAQLWNRHALPRVGHLELRAITPGVVSRLRADLEAAGVGAPTIRKTMSVLQSMLRRAVEEDRIRSNPVAQVRKPAAARQRAVRPLPPATIEAVRGALTGDDAILITVLAYAGLRPEEALALQWRHIRQGTILVEQKNVDGEIVLGQKGQGAKDTRTINMLTAVRQDLAEYRLASGRPDDDAYVFPGTAGLPWRMHTYRNWRKRVFRVAAHAAGLTTNKPPWSSANPYDGPRPYDLRHSFASLLLHAGELSVVEISRQLGHGTETLLATYAHVLEELKDQPKVSADDQIAQARAARARRLG